MISRTRIARIDDWDCIPGAICQIALRQMDNLHIGQTRDPVLGDQAAVAVIGCWLGAEQARAPVALDEFAANGLSATLGQEG